MGTAVRKKSEHTAEREQKANQNVFNISDVEMKEIKNEKIKDKIKKI